MHLLQHFQGLLDAMCDLQLVRNANTGLVLQKPWKDGCRHPSSGPAASGTPGAVLASLGSPGADVLLCGVVSSVGLGNCLIHTDKEWQVISPFFHFTGFQVNSAPAQGV